MAFLARELSVLAYANGLLSGITAPGRMIF